MLCSGDGLTGVPLGNVGSPIPFTACMTNLTASGYVLQITSHGIIIVWMPARNNISTCTVYMKAHAEGLVGILLHYLAWVSPI